MSSRVQTSVFLTLIVALLTAVPAFCQAPGRTTGAKPDSALMSAKAQLAKGDLKSAEESLWKVLSSDPNNSNALLLFGRIRGQQQRYSEAEALFQRVVQLAPRSIPAHVYLADTCLAEHKLAEATAEYKRALELEPDSVDVKVALAKLYAADGQFSTALSALETVPSDRFPAEAIPVRVGCLLALDKKNEAIRLATLVKSSPAIDLALAEVFLTAKLPDEALKMLSGAAASGKRPPPRFYFLKARALDATGDPSAALVNFQKALALAPTSEEFLLATAELYSRQNKHPEAFEVLQRAFKLDPNSLKVLRPFIMEAVFSKKSDQAVDAAEQLESKSDQPQDQYVVASVLLQNARPSEAVPLLEKYVSQVPEDTRAWLGLGLGYKDEKRLGDAQRAFEHALQVDPKQAEAEFQLGALMSDQGNSGLALQHFEKALELDPNHSQSLASLGTLYLQAGQVEKARDVLQKSESLSPNSPETEYGLALAYSKLGNRELAKTHMDRFEQLRRGVPKKDSKSN